MNLNNFLFLLLIEKIRSEHLIAKFEFIEKKLNNTITFEKSGDFKTLSVRFDPLDNFIASGFIHNKVKFKI